MLFQVHPQSPVPIYEQIVGGVIFSIASGGMAAGEIIPSVRDLAQRILAHPNTVARAYQELERRGVLAARRGVGMEVTPEAPRLCRDQRQEIVRTQVRDALRSAVASALTATEIRRLVDEELHAVNGEALRSGETIVTAIIETHGLTKSYAGGAGLHDLDLSVPAGAVFALLGDNGAGKSTTIKLLTGLLPPDAGRATVLGRDCWTDAVDLRHKVGYVPERPRFYDWMTADELGWFTAGFYATGFLRKFQEWCDRFKLNRSARLKTLSKGEYAKVGLALALAPDPEVLILDEPTSGLDLRVRREFLESMVALAADGRTVLISSHQVAEVERVASHVAFLARGRLLLTATMDELRRRLVRFRLRFEGEPPDASRLGRVLHRNGSGRLWQAVVQDPVPDAVESLRATAGVAEFEADSLTLEEAYAALVTQEDAP